MPLPPCVDNEGVSVILEVVVCEGAKLRVAEWRLFLLAE